MHEIGLVDDILCIINAKLKNLKEGSRVKRVNISIGELEHTMPDDFEFHFRERTRGTYLENVELKFKKVKVRFRCKECDYEFLPEEDMDRCPDCKSSVNDIIAGTGIFVESIEII